MTLTHTELANACFVDVGYTCGVECPVSVRSSRNATEVFALSNIVHLSRVVDGVTDVIKVCPRNGIVSSGGSGHYGSEVVTIVVTYLYERTAYRKHRG